MLPLEKFHGLSYSRAVHVSTITSSNFDLGMCGNGFVWKNLYRMNSEKILTFETNLNVLLYFSVMLSVTWTPLFNLPTVFCPIRTLSHVWCLWMLLIRYSSHKLHWVASLYLVMFVCQDVCVNTVCCRFFSYSERISTGTVISSLLIPWEYFTKTC